MLKTEGAGEASSKADVDEAVYMSDLKNLLAPFGGRDDEANALEVAFSLAEVFAAQVQVLHVSPDPKNFMAAAYVGMGVPAPSFDSITKDIEKHNEANQKSAKEKYQKAIEEHIIDHDDEVVSSDRASTSFRTAIGNAGDIVAIKGRLADLIIMSRTIKEVSIDYESAMIGALFNTGRPVLFIPPGDIHKDIDLRVVIAWNGSAQAARAVASAMPLLRRSLNATKVYALTVNTGESKNFPITPQELCLYLKQHGIEAEIILADDKGLATPVEILSEAKTLDAGMIVMGAFSHSRMREMILGGVTNFMLDNADIPVFMAH